MSKLAKIYSVSSVGLCRQFRLGLVGFLTGVGALVIGLTPVGAVDLEFVTHVEADMWEQDVFVDLSSSAKKENGVFRVGPSDFAALAEAPVYATTQTIHHDPVNAAAAGPYPRGEALGMSLGDWLAASGTGSYRCSGGNAQIEASFVNLVPNGVYTMWYFFLPTPAAVPFSTYDLPVGDRTGRENAFFADSSGRASFALSLTNCLQGGGSQLAAGLAVAWHSDGATYGSYPGGFGRATHVQLFLILPPDDELNG